MAHPNPWAKIAAYADKPERLLIGLMSGTSVDGVDAALVRVSGTRRATKADALAFVTHPFPPDLRARVLSVSHGEGNAEIVSRLSVDLGHLFADAARAVLQSANVSPTDVDAVASHGQTVSHTAQTKPYGATLQIGDASVIAQAIGVPVVSDFRTADVALGGQGAPLVPYADWCLLTHKTKTRCVQNIGGIGNVTYLPADAKPEHVLGFDTGPGNMLIDRAAQHVTNGQSLFDEGGRLAERGYGWPIDKRKPIWAFLLNQPFLMQTPPKSAGREEFGEAFFQKILEYDDTMVALVNTMTCYTAYSIADAYTRFLPSLPDEVIVGGGGAKNPVLMKLLAELLAPIPVLTHTDVGMNSDSKEAVAFAVLANETLIGNPSNLPSVTGASRPAVLGKVTLP